MKTCPACREKIQDDALRCKHCSMDLNVQKCPWCAELIDENARKCKYCKSYVDKVKCAGCEQQVEVAAMRCEKCLRKTIEEEVIERWQSERFKMKLRNWIGTAVITGLVVFGLLKIF